MATDITKFVQINRIGWEAIWDNDGFWIGTPAGVPCYGHHDLALIALNILARRDSVRIHAYRIRIFDGANVDAGTYTPKKSLEEVFAELE